MIIAMGTGYIISIFDSIMAVMGANAIGNLKDTHLSDFFRRVAYRKGRQAAVSATARKLGVIIWTMVTKKVPYSPPKEYLFLDQKRKLKKSIKNKTKEI